VSGPDRRAGPALATALALSLALLSARPAQAVLGEAASSVQADQLRLAAQRRTSRTLDAEVQVLTLPDGSSIRQYLTPAGLVYAVAWNTRSKPRLDQLLGAHFAAYAQGGRLAMSQRAGVHHHAVVEQGDLVVESSAHLNAHVGRAWLRSLLPTATARDAIR
jgi:hypothetical protein